MRADYDSEANTLELVLRDVVRFPAGVAAAQIGETVTVDADADGTAYVILVLDPESDTAAADLLEAAKTYRLDEAAVLAAAKAALAAPDRAVSLEVAPA